MSHPNSLDLEAVACGEVRDSVTAHVDDCEACSAFVKRVQSAGPPRPRVFAPPRSNVRAAAWVVLPLAAAAAVVLARRPSDRPQLDTAAPPIANTAVSFKGTLPIAVVRDRDGDQARFVGRVAVRPEDRFRIEVALDREEVILAGVLGDDGSWLELMPAISRASGTYFSEHSAHVDASPLRGTVLVGAPVSVNLARSTRRFDDVSSLRIEWEAP